MRSVAPVLSVIIIDDEKLIREGLKDYIDWDSLGFRVVDTAGDGEEGLRKILELKPDLVLSDIRLPLMTGIDLLKDLYQRRINSCHVILISAYSDFSYAQEAMRYGAFDYILKPIEEDVLAETVCRCRDRIFAQRDAPSIAATGEDEDAELASEHRHDSEGYKSRLIQQAIHYIEQNYSHEIHLEQVAVLSNLSVSHFSKIFKKVTGESFSRFVYKLRMEKAKELIDTSNYKIYEISEMVGYTDISHFSKKFKEHFGHSPVHYR